MNSRKFPVRDLLECSIDDGDLGKNSLVAIKFVGAVQEVVVWIKHIYALVQHVEAVDKIVNSIPDWNKYLQKNNQSNYPMKRAHNNKQKV